MKKVVTFIVSLILANSIYSQIDTTEIIKATNFSIPSSHAFVLLGNNTVDVIRPSFTKDLKLDYIINDGNLVSDLAIDLNPVWMVFFEKLSIEDYRKTSKFARILSTTNVSIGTSEINEQKRLAYSFTCNFLRLDPIMDRDYSKDLSDILVVSKEHEVYTFERTFKIQKNDRKIKFKQSQLLIDTIPAKRKLKISQEIEILQKKNDTMTKEIEMFNNLVSTSKNAILEKHNEKYIEDNWKKPTFSVGFGEVFNYNSSDLDSIKFENKGFGFWLNGSIGFDPLNLFRNKENKISDSKNKAIISGLIKFVNVDTTTIQFYGVNLRYGSSKLNFFVESSYETNLDTELITFSYGGEYRIDLMKTIQFSLKTFYDNDFNLSNLYPSIKLNWSLGNDPFK